MTRRGKRSQRAGAEEKQEKKTDGIATRGGNNAGRSYFILAERRSFKKDQSSRPFDISVSLSVYYYYYYHFQSSTVSETCDVPSKS